MAKQNINIGSQPNDGTGDTLRVAFDKINDNTDELYDLVTDDVVIPLQGAFADDADAANNGVTAGQYYQTNGNGAPPLNVAGILMVKQ